MLVIRRSALLSLPVLLCGSLFGGSNPELGKVLSNLPVQFEANAGQHNPDVKFTARTDGYSLFFTKRDVVFVPSGPGSKAVTISLVNGSREPVVEGMEPLAATTSYFTGNQKSQWKTGIHQFGKVRYGSVYRGVDLVYYGTGRQLEYDFILKPAADPRQIQMNFRGASWIRMSPEGDLLINSGTRELRQKKPVAYQIGASGERLDVACRFRLAGKHVAGFAVGSYDPSRELIIDPPLIYSSYVGGSSETAITTMVTDRSGVMYVAGYTFAGDIASTDTSFQGTHGSLQDVFIARINPNRTGAASVTAFTYLGGDGKDIPTGIAIGPDGLLYLTGYTLSTNFPTAGGGPSQTLSGTQDGFVVKLYPSLDGLTYGSYLGGSDIDTANAIAVDGNGIYITGTTKSSNFPVSGDALQSVTAGGIDAFVTKLDVSGASIVYSTYLGGERTEEGNAIVVTAQGRVYVAGWTSSANFPMAGNSFQRETRGGGEIFLAGLELQLGNGALVYSTYLGGAGDDEPRKLALDASGSLLLTGFTTSKNFPTSAGAFQPTQGGIANAFAVKFDPRQDFANGLQYSTYLGGSDGEAGFDIAGDAAGNIYVTGYTYSANFPVTAKALQGQIGQGVKAFVSKIDPKIAGAPGLVYSTYLGGDRITAGYGVSATGDGRIYVGGVTLERNHPTTDGAYQAVDPAATGTYSGFVTVIDPLG